MSTEDDTRRIVEEERLRHAERQRLAALERKSHAGLAAALIMVGLALAAIGVVVHLSSKRDNLQVAAENTALALSCLQNEQDGSGDAATCDEKADEGGNIPLLVGGLAAGGALFVVGLALGMRSSKVDAARRRAEASSRS